MVRTGPTRQRSSLRTLSTSTLILILVTLLTTLLCLRPVSANAAVAPRAAVEADSRQPTMAVVLVPSSAYLEFVHEVSHPVGMFEKRQLSAIPPIGGGTSSAGLPASSTASVSPTPTLPPVIPPVNNTTSTVGTSTSTILSTSSSTQAITTSSRTTTAATGTSTNPTSSAAGPTQTTAPSSGGGASIGMVFGIVGGLVVAIGAAIVAFKCVASRKDRARRNKEIAATLAESFDRSGSDKYHELGDGPGTPIPAGAKLSRQGSQQDGYYQKEQGGDYYNNNHYVQERYGGPNGGYDETEMSVMGGQGGGPRPMSPYMGQAPVGGGGGGQYAGYNDYNYDYGGGNGGYNNNHGHQQGGYGYGQRY